MEIAPELVANQLNVRYGALVLQVLYIYLLFLSCISIKYLCSSYSHLSLDRSLLDSSIDFIMLQVPANSVAAKAGILPTTRGFAGNILLGDIIVAVDDKPVSCPLLLLSFFSPCII